jgi:hypothetical protein
MFMSKQTTAIWLLVILVALPASTPAQTAIRLMVDLLGAAFK